MKTYYKVKFPLTKHMSAYSTIATETFMETKEENALADYNSARVHDGLKQLEELPYGTTFERIEREE